MDFEVLSVKVYGNTGIVMQNQMGLLWLTAALLFLIYGVLQLANAKYAWLILLQWQFHNPGGRNQTGIGIEKIIPLSRGVQACCLLNCE